MSNYVEIEDVTYLYRYPSGRAIHVRVGEQPQNVPVSVIGANSEIHDGCTHAETGTLTVARWWAEKEGLLDGEPEGSGLVFKKLPRSRLSPPAYNISEGRLKRIEARARAVPLTVHEDGELRVGGRTVAVLDGVPELAEYLTHGPIDAVALVQEVRALRAWARKVTGGK